MELRGQIEEFIYQNESNSYTIAIFSTEEQDVVTVVGYLPFIAVGDTLKLQGKMVVHQEYGEQFKIETFEKMMPETAAAPQKPAFLSPYSAVQCSPENARAAALLRDPLYRGAYEAMLAAHPAGHIHRAGA